MPSSATLVTMKKIPLRQDSKLQAARECLHGCIHAAIMQNFIA